MKLLPALLTTSAVYGEGIDERRRTAASAAAASFGHDRIRNAFLLPEMDDILAAQEQLLEDVELTMSSPMTLKNFDLEMAVLRSDSLSAMFANQTMRQGCDSSFPSLDGSCNAPNNEGRSMSAYKRLVAADYCDGRQATRCGERRAELPNERKVSLEMGRSAKSKTSQEVSYAFTAWGQFLTHDIIQTPDSSGGRNVCGCRPHPFCKTVPLIDDPVLRFKCLFIIRSASKLGAQNGRPVRQQLNQLSAFIDGTTIYGFTSMHKNMLMERDGMHLKMNEGSKFGSFLPTFDEITNKELQQKFASSALFNNKLHPESIAGDTRVLENPVLTSFHTLFARLHNHVVDILDELNPAWSTSRIFHEARLYVMSVIKHITYEEFLPVLLGPKGNEMVANPPTQEPLVQPFQGHKPPSQSDPSIRNEFATVAFRFGHSMVPETLHAADANLNSKKSVDLKDNWFDPDIMWTEGPGACLRGAMMGDTHAVSGKFAQSTHNDLFKPMNGRHGVDLLAINIARGRDHGIPPYTRVRDFCMRHPQYKALFDGVPEMQDGWDNVVSQYQSENEVDFYAGFIMEKQIAGGQVGPTATCVIVDQFIALKKGDRFYHENKDVFSIPQLAAVKDAGLAKVMCNVMEGMRKSTTNPFIKSNAKLDGMPLNSILDCDSLGDLDFSSWRDNQFGGDDSTPRPGTTAPDPNLPAFLCRPCDPFFPNPCGPFEPEHMVCSGFARCVCASGWEDDDADPRNGCERRAPFAVQSNEQCRGTPTKLDAFFTSGNKPKPPKRPTTQAPTEAPTEAPTVSSSAAPGAVPTEAPTAAPTEAPTAAPTEAPTEAPTAAPTAAPTEAPTAAPTAAPTEAPTAAPTEAPTEAPTAAPTEAPTAAPTEAPTAAPTVATTTTKAPTSAASPLPPTTPTPTTPAATPAPTTKSPLANTGCEADALSVFPLFGGGTWECFEASNKKSLMCRQGCPAGSLFAGSRAKIFCAFRNQRWFQRGSDKATQVFGCNKQDSTPPAAGTSGCNLEDFEGQIMTAVKRKFPTSSYQFDTSHWRMLGKSGVGLLKAKFLLPSGKVFSGIFVKCRTRPTGIDQWSFRLSRIDPATFHSG